MIFVNRVDGSRIDEPSVLDESRDADVASVEVELKILSVPLSAEFKVEAILCLEGDRRKKLVGRDVSVVPGLRFADFVDELDPAHNRPRNLDAADPIAEVGEIPTSDGCDSLNLVSSVCKVSFVTMLVKLTKSFTNSSAL